MTVEKNMLYGILREMFILDFEIYLEKVHNFVMLEVKIKILDEIFNFFQFH